MNSDPLEMTTLVPAPPYTKDELEKLYPKSLQLQLVQVVSILSASRGVSIRELRLIVRVA